MPNLSLHDALPIWLYNEKLQDRSWMKALFLLPQWSSLELSWSRPVNGRYRRKSPSKYGQICGNSFSDRTYLEQLAYRRRSRDIEGLLKQCSAAKTTAKNNLPHIWPYFEGDFTTKNCKTTAEWKPSFFYRSGAPAWTCLGVVLSMADTEASRLQNTGKYVATYSPIEPI